MRVVRIWRLLGGCDDPHVEQENYVPAMEARGEPAAAELGEHLALSTSTVLDWFEAGRLPGFKLGRVVRFRESEVVDWLEAQRG